MKPFVFSLLLIAGIGCHSSGTNKAIALNNRITRSAEELLAKNRELSDAIAAAMQNHDFSHVNTIAIDFGDLVEKELRRISRMENTGGSEKLKASMQAFLLFEQRMAAGAIQSFTRMNSNTTDEAVEAAIENLDRSVTGARPYLEAVRKEQLAYAEKNGFKAE